MVRKAHKKQEEKIIKALTRACEKAKLHVEGFIWLTHHINPSYASDSLVITCVFETREHQTQAIESGDFAYLQELIAAQLKRINITLSTPDKHIFADNEQACHEEHNSDWQRRLAAH
ncbi:Fis family transcriptional regulator [Aliiglaciecola litoralis]|uniref:Fis family transcriptional regulator n=1 Tax=Aliiglaciecola litoralis TaxID=582857 RepID=A0ABP3X1F8_9ALTE